MQVFALCLCACLLACAEAFKAVGVSARRRPSARAAGDGSDAIAAHASNALRMSSTPTNPRHASVPAAKTGADRMSREAKRRRTWEEEQRRGKVGRRRASLLATPHAPHATLFALVPVASRRSL
jgi:hypothetical protein